MKSIKTCSYSTIPWIPSDAQCRAKCKYTAKNKKASR